VWEGSRRGETDAPVRRGRRRTGAKGVPPNCSSITYLVGIPTPSIIHYMINRSITKSMAYKLE
jgi:hypothetical protein